MWCRRVRNDDLASICKCKGGRSLLGEDDVAVEEIGTASYTYADKAWSQDMEAPGGVDIACDLPFSSKARMYNTHT